MKFAIVENNKVEPVKGPRGACPNCGEELIAKCGAIKVHHWAHKNKLICDSWWENEANTITWGQRKERQLFFIKKY